MLDNISISQIVIANNVKKGFSLVNTTVRVAYKLLFSCNLIKNSTLHNFSWNAQITLNYNLNNLKRCCYKKQ